MKFFSNLDWKGYFITSIITSILIIPIYYTNNSTVGLDIYFFGTLSVFTMVFLLMIIFTLLLKKSN